MFESSGNRQYDKKQIPKNRSPGYKAMFDKFLGGMPLGDNGIEVVDVRYTSRGVDDARPLESLFMQTPVRDMLSTYAAYSQRKDIKVKRF